MADLTENNRSFLAYALAQALGQNGHVVHQETFEVVGKLGLQQEFTEALNVLSYYPEMYHYTNYKNRHDNPSAKTEMPEL